jgi:hypothetical protein
MRAATPAGERFTRFGRALSLLVLGKDILIIVPDFTVILYKEKDISHKFKISDLYFTHTQ